MMIRETNTIISTFTTILQSTSLTRLIGHEIIAMQEISIEPRDFLRLIDILQDLKTELGLIKDSIILYNSCGTSLEVAMQQRCAAADVSPYEEAGYSLISSWERLAISEHSHALYNFKYSLNYIFKLTKSLNINNVKWDQFKSAKKNLDFCMGDVDAIRDSNAHRSGRSEEIERHAIRNTPSNISIESDFSKLSKITPQHRGSHLYTTRKGRLCRHDMTYDYFELIYKQYLRVITSFPLKVEFADFPRDEILSFINEGDLLPFR